MIGLQDIGNSTGFRLLEDAFNHLFNLFNLNSLESDLGRILTERLSAANDSLLRVEKYRQIPSGKSNLSTATIHKKRRGWTIDRFGHILKLNLIIKIVKIVRLGV